ncbi:3-phosphoshikimate 1-carboxyvinyltransferase [Methanocella sp. MCL-LM]|uniref:3-phosphoshikimate 1-carboxyvinyltransferase n=1 Tax=Methanocella sp. MCL-LM TaxID=3412035 RepID=UPI003C775897
MIARISKSDVWGSVDAPPSKSYTHRAIAIGSMGHYAKITGPLLSADTLATVSACRAFGADVRVAGDTVEIAGVIGKPRVPEDVVDAKNSGTTLRLCSSIAALADGATVFTGDHSLRKRPNGPLIKALNDLGAVCYSTRGTGTAPLVIHGVMKGGRISINGGISSQFISSLLISCPFAKNDSTIVIEGELKSRPYVEVTLEMLEKAGCKIETNFEEFHIPCCQDYNLGEYRVPGDFSSASYPLAAAAITGSKVTVGNLFPSKQGDAAILEYLLDMGANVFWDEEKGTVTVQGGGLHGIDIDAGQTPDLVPTLAVLAACAEGTTHINNAEHVRYKETDRLRAMATELRKMGVKIEERQDGLDIEGGSLKGAAVDGYDDHRIVMSLAIAGLVADGPTTINTAESVDISYPAFFADLRKLGAKVEV